jgi:anti-sigma B factor antagonist
MNNVTITKTKDIHIIKLEGLLNVEYANNLEVILNELMINETPRKVILDFSNLEHISSSGLRVIMNFYKKIASKNGKLIICCAKEGIKKVLKLVELDSILKLYDTVEEGIRSLENL